MNSSTQNPFESERVSFEHLGLIGVFVIRPEFLVEIYQAHELIGTYGFHAMTVRQMEDAVTLRSTSLLKCSCVDIRLLETKARLLNRNLEFAWFYYDPKEWIFRETTL